MQTQKIIASAAAIALTLSGCATSSSDIAATYTAPLQY